MTANRYSIYPASFVHGGGTLDLQQMEDFSVSVNAQRSAIIPGGAVDQAHIGIASGPSEATLGTRDLDTYFGTGSPSAGLSCTGACTFRKQERANGSTFASSTAHNTWAAQKGFLKPNTLTASQDDEQGAKLTLGFTPLWDGTNALLTAADAVDFATAPAPAFASRFFLGPVYHNSTQIEGITDVNIDFGIEYSAKMFDGDAFPKTGAIIARRPTITFTTVDASDIYALGLYGQAITTLAVYLQRGVASGTRVAAATATHCKVTFSTGDFGAEDIAVSGPTEDGTISFTAMPTAVMTLALNSAIP